MNSRKVMIKLASMFTLMFASALCLAHEGMHAAGQAHVGESHIGLMEIALSVLAMIGISVWALKEAKSKK